MWGGACLAPFRVPPPPPPPWTLLPLPLSGNSIDLRSGPFLEAGGYRVEFTPTGAGEGLLGVKWDGTYITDGYFNVSAGVYTRVPPPPALCAPRTCALGPTARPHPRSLASAAPPRATNPNPVHGTEVGRELQRIGPSPRRRQWLAAPVARVGSDAGPTLRRALLGKEGGGGGGSAAPTGCGTGPALASACLPPPPPVPWLAHPHRPPAPIHELRRLFCGGRRGALRQYHKACPAPCALPH